MSAIVKFTPRVGVAPGTTTMQLGGYWNPYQDVIALNDAAPVQPFAQLRRDRPIRWDLVGIIGGGSLVFALTAAFIASALRR